ncbi:hypothetical protein EJ02DRAFT_256050 [Clathrospora elynae]|uniref:Uncharacterized protein n=1 Tax=Clathrospora elynae TaxID=706981 RepID=A0A6A5SIQ0_9PLEO|nr:hypothetical protein EJ02DRAFT_256050 [Clathrospora elynae]
MQIAARCEFRSGNGQEICDDAVKMDTKERRKEAYGVQRHKQRERLSCAADATANCRFHLPVLYQGLSIALCAPSPGIQHVRGPAWGCDFLETARHRTNDQVRSSIESASHDALFVAFRCFCRDGSGARMLSLYSDLLEPCSLIRCIRPGPVTPMI